MNKGKNSAVMVIVFVVLSVVLIAIPFLITNSYWIHIIDIIGIYSILALGLNILIGFTGQFSLGHAAFYGIGAYVSALLSVHYNLPIFICVIAAIIVSAIFGLILSYPCSRLQGLYLAITTIGFGQIIHTVIVEWRELTKGPMGLTKIPFPKIGNISFDFSESYYYIILVCLFLTILIATRIRYSHIGRAMRSIREDEMAAQTNGVNIGYYKMLGFVISAAFAGLGGSLYAHYLNFISPESFTFDFSTQMLVMVLVGGVGSIPGSVIGAIVVTFIPEILRDLKMYQMVVYGLILVLILIFLPNGLFQIFRNIANCLGYKSVSQDTDVTTGRENG